MPTVITMAATSRLGNVPRRVHVAPVGFEVDRVVKPILEMSGEAAVLFAQLKDRDRGGLFLRRVTKNLENRGVAVDVVREDIYDLYRCTHRIAQVFRERRGDNLFVNVSSGSKIQAFSGFLATMLVRSEGIDVTPYYAEPAEYTAPLRKPISRGLEEILPMPKLALQTPGTELRAAMRVLMTEPMSKADLSIRLAQLGVLDSSKLTAQGRPVDERARVSLQAAVDLRVVRRLEELQYVRVVRRGRKAVVSLTTLGISVAQMYAMDEPRPPLTE